MNNTMHSAFRPVNVQSYLNEKRDIKHLDKTKTEITEYIYISEIETPQSQPYNVRDEVIFKSEISIKQNEELEVKSDPPFVDVSDEVNMFIKDLFEFFIDSYEKQETILPIMVKNYIKERNKNPVAILYEMTTTNEIIGMKNTSPNSLSLRKLHEKNREIGFIHLGDMHLKGLGVNQFGKRHFRFILELLMESPLEL
ncbi:hypothetical protein Glove_551g56 [Diversispora epigaea]|uniref:Uncharacterized protein n=1 Tax=Diversispora epigaea TaxID=1348612 RepID=A0A397GD90_9GLOM|nr:hypothetical protein Glove_551g56 [Diversispora epigaea]